MEDFTLSCRSQHIRAGPFRCTAHFFPITPTQIPHSHLFTLAQQSKPKMTSTGQTDDSFQSLMSEEDTKALISQHLSLSKLVFPPDVVCCLWKVEKVDYDDGNIMGNFGFKLSRTSQQKPGLVISVSKQTVEEMKEVLERLEETCRVTDKPLKFLDWANKDDEQKHHTEEGEIDGWQIHMPANHHDEVIVTGERKWDGDLGSCWLHTTYKPELDDKESSPEKSDVESPESAFGETSVGDEEEDKAVPDV